MNRILAVVISILVFTLFCLYCVRTHAPMIEHDILARTMGAVLASGTTAEGLSVSGRDVYLSGTSGSAIVSEPIRATARGVRGVRVVNVAVTDAPSARAMDLSPDAKTMAVKTQVQQQTQEKLNAVLQTRIVEFKTGSADLTREGRQTLDEIRPILAATPGLVCSIRGFTDSRGDAQENMELSRERALSTKQYLTNKGIESSRMTAEGFGAATPIAPNDTAEGRRQNRRIEFLLGEKN